MNISSGAQAAIVVYDITSPDTFKRAQAWVKELRQQANQNIVIALAGNKADLAQQRTVDNEVISTFFSISLKNYFQEAESYAKENNLLYMETSAKTALNVNDLFLQIGELTRERVF